MASSLSRYSDEELDKMETDLLAKKKSKKSNLSKYSDEDLDKMEAENSNTVSEPMQITMGIPSAHPNYPKETTGWGGIASDALSKAIENIMGIPSAIMNFPSEMYGTGKQIISEPLRAAGNIGAGFSELGHGILSAPGNIRDYLARKEIVSKNAPSFRLPESILPKDFNYAEALGVHGEQPGDITLRGLPATAALAPIGAYVPLLSRSGKIKKLGLARDIAEKAATEQNELIDALKKQYAEKSAGLQTPESITRTISQKEAASHELSPAANIPYENTENLLNWPTSEELVSNAKKAKQQTISNIETDLGKGKDLDVEAANEVKSSIEQMKKYIQNNFYKPVEKYAENSYVQVPNNHNIKEIEDELRKITTSSEFTQSPGFDKLKQAMIKSKTKNDLIPMQDFITQWKETKQAAALARSKAFQEGGKDQAYWYSQSENFKNLADKQLELLRTTLPQQHFDKLLTANKLWKEEIAPVYGNKIYEQSKNGKINSKNIMHEIRGDNPGDRTMRKIILSNPKLAKFIVGHSFANDPEKLLFATENEQQYINKVPGLLDKINRLKAHNREIEISKAQTKNFQEKRSKAETIQEGIVKNQKQRINAINEKNKLRAEIEDLSQKRSRLIEELDKGKITKQEFERLDKQYKDKLNKKQSYMTKLKKGVAIIGIGDIIKKLLQD